MTLNGFPYKAFHAPVVKRDVYRPHWAQRRAARLHARAGAAARARCCPTTSRRARSRRCRSAGARAGTTRRRPRRCARSSDVAGGLAALRGARPASGSGSRWSPSRAARSRRSRRRATFLAGLAPEWIGVCLDACHLAVQFEAPADAVARLARRRRADRQGAGVERAARARAGVGARAASCSARFDEPRFLHQVRERVERARRGHRRPARGAGRRAAGRAASGACTSTCRSTRAEHTTQDELDGDAGRAAGGPAPLTRHFEVETYTWSVLRDGPRRTTTGSWRASPPSWNGRATGWSRSERRRSDDAGRDRRGRPHAARARAHAAAVEARRATASRRGWTRSLPAVTCSVQSTFLTGLDADRPRHRRQRLVLPRPRRGLPLAPAQQARAGREGLGDGAARASPASAPRTCAGGTRWARRPTSPSRRGRSTTPTGASRPTATPIPPAAARQPDRPARRVPAVPVLGPDGEHHVVALDRRRGARSLLDDEQLDLLLVYLPHLDYDHQRFGPEGAGGGRGGAASSTRSPGDLVDHARGARRPGRRAVASTASRDARRPVDDQPRAAPRRAAERLHAGGHGVPRPVDVARVRGRRPPDRARVRRATRPTSPRRARRSPALPGVGEVLEGDDAAARRPRPRARGRAGRCVAERDAWFTYYYWLDNDARARLRPAGRDPPQAGLRPGRAVHGPRRPLGARRARARRWRARRRACAT